ncbi:MAG: HAD family hydrolase [Nitrososphaeria archaeon]
MTKTTLVLDFDGVITDLNVDWKLVYKKISELVGYDVDSLIPFWKKYFGTELFRRCNKIIEEYELQAVSRCRPFEDVEPALASFDGPIYIASMQSQKALEEFFSKNGLRHYLREVLGRDNFGSKSRQIEYIIGRERDYRHIVFVDDVQENLNECSRLKIRCILFNRKSGDSLHDLLRRL